MPITGNYIENIIADAIVNFEVNNYGKHPDYCLINPKDYFHLMDRLSMWFKFTGPGMIMDNPKFMDCELIRSNDVPEGSFIPVCR